MEPSNQPTTYQLVVHRAMGELEWLNVYLKDKCHRYLGKEHSPDEGCKRTHCHFAIEYKHTKQALTKFLNSNDIKGSDNFGILAVCQDTKKPYDFEKLCGYILKGSINETVKSNGVTNDVIESYRISWKDYQANGKIESEKVIYDEWNLIKKAGKQHFTTEYFSFDDVRRFVMRWYWKRDGRLPHATSFKRNASSLYLCLIEQYPNLRSESTALDEIMEKYY